MNPSHPLAYAETGLRNTAARIDSAYSTFAETLQSIVNMPHGEAVHLARFYVSKKLAKLDSVGGRITVKHGAYLDVEAVHNVRRMVREA